MPDFTHVVKLKPKDKDARQKYEECKKAVKVAAFEAAIETEKSKPISETLDVESIVVPDSYTGPKLTLPITQDFVMAMVDTFRNQKLIHRKYTYQLLIALMQVLVDTPSLMDIPLPPAADGYTPKFSVCGDTHGRFSQVYHFTRPL